MTPRHPWTLSAFSLLLALAGCVAVPGNVVALTASSAKPLYAQGERITIVLNLKNATVADVVLSKMVTGNISVDSFTRDGVAVPRLDSVVKFEDELGYQMSSQTSTVEPGDSFTLRWGSSYDPFQKGQTLQTVVYQPGSPNFSTDYLVGPAGKYALTIRYQFPRTADPSGAVFSGPVAPAAVTFTVSP